MMNYGKTIFLFLMVLFCSCTTPAKKQAASNLAPEEVMAMYKDSMSYFWNTYDKKLEKMFKSYQEIWNKTAWAVIQPSSTIMALTSGKPIAFLAVYHPRHPRLEKWFPTLSTSMISGRPMILIRPDKVSKRFAAVFLLHEMSHVAAKLNNVQITPMEDEFFAYSLEKAALNAVTGWGYDEQLDTILRVLQIKSEEEILNAKSDKFFLLLTELDQKISADSSHSPSEAEMRAGFYHLSLGLRYVENQKLPLEPHKRRVVAFLDKFIQRFGKPTPAENP